VSKKAIISPALDKVKGKHRTAAATLRPVSVFDRMKRIGAMGRESRVASRESITIGEPPLKFQNECVIRVPSRKLWNFLTDIPSVARCLPGVEQVNAAGEGKYAGTLALKIGVIKLRLAGNLTVEVMDAERQVATMGVQAADERISGLIQGTISMHLEELGPDETKLIANTDVNLFGKIGEFGQPLIKRKADQMMNEFAANLAQTVGESAPRTPTGILGLSS
jgi:uncharacterized protein